MSESRTPETDAREIESYNEQGSYEGHTGTVSITFARQLEIQRDEARAEAARLKEALESATRILSPYKLSDTWHGNLYRKLLQALIGPADAPEVLP